MRAAGALPVTSPWSIHDKVVSPASAAPHGLGLLSVNLPSTIGAVENMSVQYASKSDRQTMWPASAHVQPSMVAVSNQPPRDFLPNPVAFTGNSSEQRVQPVATQSDQQFDLSSWSGVSSTRPASGSSELLHLLDLQPTDPLPDINPSVTNLFCPVSVGSLTSPNLSALLSTSKQVVQSPNDVLDTTTMGDNTTGLVSKGNGRFSEVDRNLAVPNWITPTVFDLNYVNSADESEYMQRSPMLPPVPPPRCPNLHPEVPTMDVWFHFSCRT